MYVLRLILIYGCRSEIIQNKYNKLYQGLYFLFKKMSIIIFCKMSCVQIFMLWRKINICTTFLYFIMANVSLSFEENSENLPNIERLNNNLKLLDVILEKLSFPDFMSCNVENHVF